MRSIILAWAVFIAATLYSIFTSARNTLSLSDTITIAGGTVVAATFVLVGLVLAGITIRTIWAIWHA